MRRRLIIRRPLLVVAAITSVFGTICASAQGGAGKFVPSETEWTMWPSYCQARYLSIPLGRSTVFANRLSRSQISAEESKLRPRTYHSIHHYCFGLGYLMRAQQASSIAEKDVYTFLLNNAVNEGQYTLRRMDITDPMAADVAYLMAKAHSMLGDPSEGVGILEQVIAAQPELPGAYVALVLHYRSNKEMTQAIQTVERALKHVPVPSAELYYTAGIAYVEKKELETAQRYAIEAYNLGYPLPGLKRKLAKLGYWPPKTPTDDATQVRNPD